MCTIFKGVTYVIGIIRKREVKEILKIAIEMGGSTIKSYHPGKDIDGNFQTRIKIYGKDALFAYTDYAQGQLTDRFLSSFRNNDWYGGFSKYLDFGGTILEDAQDGSPMEKHVDMATTVGGSSLIALLVGLVTGRGRVNRMRRTMKNTGIKKTAVNYVSQEKAVKLNSRQDHYVNTTVNRVRIHHDSDKSSGGGHSGGGTSVNSHGFSGGSGKF